MEGDGVIDVVQELEKNNIPVPEFMKCKKTPTPAPAPTPKPTPTPYNNSNSNEKPGESDESSNSSPSQAADSNYKCWCYSNHRESPTGICEDLEEDNDGYYE